MHTGPAQGRRSSSAGTSQQNRLNKEFYRLSSMKTAAAHLMRSGTEVAYSTCKRKHLLVLKGQQEMSTIYSVLTGRAAAPRKRSTHGPAQPRPQTASPRLPTFIPWCARNPPNSLGRGWGCPSPGRAQEPPSFLAGGKSPSHRRRNKPLK